MENELEHIRKRLSDEGDKTVAFFNALEPADWKKQVYTTGSGWRVGDILAHFISAERAYQYYLQRVLEGGSGAPESLDIDQFNEAEVATMNEPPAELLNSYIQVRQDTILLTNKLNEADLRRVATHPWFDEKEIGWYLKLIYRHNTMHRMDIRKSLKAGGPLPHTDVQQTGRQVNPPEK
ncbi:MAG: DinB family protein [Anaerolineales bacterium]